MTEPTINCPQCRAQIRLTESLAAPLLEATRHQYEKALEEQRQRVAAEEMKKARAASAADMDAKAAQLQHLQEVMRAQEAKLADAQRAQASLIKKQRELDDQMRELDLTVQKRVSESLEEVRIKARHEVEGALKQKVLEKDQTILSMQHTIEQLRQKAEQGSQQTQGEAQEIALETLLRGRFPSDQIDPVAKGEFGGDILHQVRAPSGSLCGTILWESKHTRHWSDGWLGKLREDQRSAKAEVCVLVSHTLPKNVDTFNLIDGVWVLHPRCVLPVAALLRDSLVQVGAARQVFEGQQSKTEMVYQYLTGPRFKQRVEAIVEAFSSMQEDLDRERKVIMKQWAKREEQIARVMGGTIGMYGDLQGIAGKSLQEIEGLELRALEMQSDLL